MLEPPPHAAARSGTQQQTSTAVPRSGFGHRAPGTMSAMAVTARPKLDAHKLRADFPIFEQAIHGKPLAYLDSAATLAEAAPGARRDARVLRDLVRERPPRRLQLAERATAGYEGAREKVRAFLNAPATREVIFTRNATEGDQPRRVRVGARQPRPRRRRRRHGARAPLELRALAVRSRSGRAPSSG